MCTACNLASPILTGFLFEMLVGKGRHSLAEYPLFFAAFAAIYVLEPLLTRVRSASALVSRGWRCISCYALAFWLASGG